MLIEFDELYPFLKDIKITGVFHIGAHECEELPFYNRLGISSEEVVWIDAIDSKVEENTRRGIPNVYTAVVSDKDDQEVTFNISNNIQSSSILDFGTHAQEHPWVFYVDRVKMKTTTIDSFFKKNNLSVEKYNFWNLDIQGAELLALKGGTDSLLHAKVLYLEVNERELYKNCGLVQELDEFLVQHSFKRVLTKMTPSGWGDALYIKF